MKRRIFALLLALALAAAMLPASALASGGDEPETIDLAEFLERVEATRDGSGNLNYDGGGVTVKWSPKSYCDGKDIGGCLFVGGASGDDLVSTGNTPQRLQNTNAQYQILTDAVDVSISNVNFEYVPADVVLCMNNKGWSGNFTKEQVRNGELQFQNSGNLKITGCSFEKVIVSPYNKGASVSYDTETIISGCRFSNIYDAYAVKDIYTGSAVISNCIFSNLSGGVYFEGRAVRGEISIVENTFTGADAYAEAGKENTRGAIQFSGLFTMDRRTEITIEGNVFEGNTPEQGMPVLRQLSDVDCDIAGWTPGELFTIKLDAADKALPGLPSGDGYYFLGWAEDPGAQTATYMAGEAPESTVMYYSIWHKVELEADKTAAWDGEQGGTATVTLEIPTDSYMLGSDPVSVVGGGDFLQDVIGEDFELLSLESFKIVENGVELPADIDEETNSASFGVGENDGGAPYVLSYDAEKKLITLRIKKNLMSGDSVALSYQVKLANAPAEPGTYQLPTNVSATLFEENVELGIPIFTYNVPTLEYTVAEPVVVPPVTEEPEYAPNWLNTRDHFAYIVGYADGSVRPEGEITRAEVATIFFRLLTDEARAEFWSGESGYSDVSSASWYNNAVATLSSMGVIKGYDDGAFRPDAPITRAEFAAIATRFFDYTAKYAGAFDDVSASAWYAGSVQAAVDMGLAGGYPDGGFHPDDNITRAEAVTIVNRVLGRAPDAEHLLGEDVMNVWPDNPRGAWFYADVQEATNSHAYVWLGEIESWTAKLAERDWAALELEWAGEYGK